MAGKGEGEGGRGCWGEGGRGKGLLAFLKNLWVERGALSEVKAFFLRTGGWRVESGINLLQPYRPHHLHENQPNL